MIKASPVECRAADGGGQARGIQLIASALCDWPSGQRDEGVGGGDTF